MVGKLDGTTIHRKETGLSYGSVWGVEFLWAVRSTRPSLMAIMLLLSLCMEYLLLMIVECLLVRYASL
jgi:hypothetical protein